MDYSYARDSGNLTDGFANPFRGDVRATSVIESGNMSINTHSTYSVHL